MFAIGNDELKQAKLISETVKCPVCGESHKIEYGKEKQQDGTWKETNFIAFFRCGEKAFLAGIDGKSIMKD